MYNPLGRRKKLRLSSYDYNQPGVYFITLCTKNRRAVLSHIVGAAQCAAPTVVSKIIGAFKSLTSREFGEPLWQRAYYDHVIRDEADYQTKWGYIDTNPARWAEDEYFA